MFSNKSDDQNQLFGKFVYERLIHPDHLLKQIDKAVDFDFVAQETREFYASIGRPGLSPVMLFKMLLVGFLYNISDRQLEEEINLNIAYKWFVGLDLDQTSPDHSTLTRFRDRLGEEGFRQLFNRIVEMAKKKGLIIERLTIIDSTDVAANVDVGRLKQFKQDEDDHNYVDRHSPDCDARFGRKSKSKGFYGYKDHLAIDADSSIITAVETTPGNIPDRDVFSQLIRGRPHSVTADKGYDAEPNWSFLDSRSIEAAIIPVRRSRGRPLKAERQRSWIERKFAELKRYHGLGRCRWIGLLKAGIQALISCMAVNLKHIARPAIPLSLVESAL